MSEQQDSERLTIPEGPGTVYDAPNQQAVRPDESAPWDEGTGGAEQPNVPKLPEAEVDIAASPDELDAMTKAELLDYAYDLGVDVDSTATKADVRAVIDAAEGRG